MGMFERSGGRGFITPLEVSEPGSDDRACLLGQSPGADFVHLIVINPINVRSMRHGCLGPERFSDGL